MVVLLLVAEPRRREVDRWQARLALIERTLVAVLDHLGAERAPA